MRVERKMIKSFRHVCIVVRNLKKSLHFYRDILGFKVQKTVDAEGEYPQALLNKKGIRLMYVKMLGPGQPKNSHPVFELHYWKYPKIPIVPGYNHVSFTVKDIDFLYEKLLRRGVKFISAPKKTPHGSTKVCFAYDPDRHLIEFIEDLERRRK